MFLWPSHCFWVFIIISVSFVFCRSNFVFQVWIIINGAYLFMQTSVTIRAWLLDGILYTSRHHGGVKFSTDEQLMRLCCVYVPQIVRSMVMLDIANIHALIWNNELFTRCVCMFWVRYFSLLIVRLFITFVLTVTCDASWKCMSICLILCIFLHSSQGLFDW